MGALHSEQGSLESRKDFKNTPSGQYKYWLAELKASEYLLKDFRRYGTKIVQNFKGGPVRNNTITGLDSAHRGFKLNLFHSNVITLQSMLYGNLPKVTVKRRHDDPDDDVGRLAALILERLLNNDVQDNGKEYNSVLRAVLQDRLLPGLGLARLRYVFDDKSGVEEAPIDYYHWRDVSYGWSRTFSDIPWIGYRSFLTKDAVEARFGAEVAKAVVLKNQAVVQDEDEEAFEEDDTDSAWKKAEIWEIWDKKKREVIWVSPGYDKVLDTKPDPLGLSGFYPNPPFLVANVTSSLYVPVSDFYLAQDLYNEIDILQTRISIITEAVKVVGVYDRSAEGVQRMFDEGVDNDLIPVDNWAFFAEKGGIKGQIDWVPIAEISKTLTELRGIRDETIGLLQQVTGMSDIMRGELGGQYEGVGQSELKAKFGSVRVQALQDEFACFASDLLQIKAEVIGNHFSPESIAKYANLSEIMESDRELIQPAIELIKNPTEARMRVEVSPESVAMVDYAQLKQERTEYINALAVFMQSSAPLMEADPNAKPFLLQLLQWGLAGFKGAGQIEGVIDKAIQASQKEAENQEETPDPEMQKMQAQVQLEQMKQQGEMAKLQLKHQQDMELGQAKLAADLAVRKTDLDADKETRSHDAMAAQQAVIDEMQAELAVIAAKMHADIQLESVSSEINVQQNQAEVEGEMAKAALDAALEIDKIGLQTEAKIEEDNIKSENKIKQEKAKPKPAAGPKKE